METNDIVVWILRIVIAVILGQTLFFKFTGAEESVFIFSALGVEPWGRILTGVLELVAVILLLVPGKELFGALLASLLMIGAIGAHVVKLGVVVQGDGGLLFGLAAVVLVCAAAVLLFRRADVLLLLGTISENR